MSAATEFDVGPLTWVKSEIDLALGRALAALDQFSASAASGSPDPTQLRFCRTHLHQVQGALTIIGLDGVTQFAEALEGLLETIETQDNAADESSLGLARRALQAIGLYLGGLVNGQANQPLRLLPLYQEIQTRRGERRHSAVDLFFPDLSIRPPRPETPVKKLGDGERSQRLKQERWRFQRGLLSWLRAPREQAGVGEMLTAVRRIEETQETGAARAFWWVTGGLLTALADGGVPDKAFVKTLCSRIDMQIRRLLEGSRNVAERLMRDTLYLVAVADSDHPAVREIKAAYRLEAVLPVTGEAVVPDAVQAVADRLRETIPALEETWNRFCAGSTASLPVFKENSALLSSLAEQGGHTDFRRLAQAIAAAANWLEETPARHSEPLAMEIATGILLAQNAQKNYPRLGGDFAHQVDVTVARIHACIAGSPPPPESEIPLLDEMSRLAQEKLLIGQVAKEIQSNLVQIEQDLDGFFRDPEKRSELAGLEKLFRQIVGALTMLRQDGAVAALQGCLETVQRFADANYAPQEGEFEQLASQLSILGFFVEALPRGVEDFERFVRQIQAPPRGGADAGDNDAAISVEQEVVQSRRETRALLEALKEQPEDAGLREEIRHNLTTLKSDADLLADTQLGEQAKAMLNVLASGENVAPRIEQALAALKPETVEAAQPSRETLQLSQASNEEIDAELLGIFLEEANEVLAEVDVNLRRLKSNMNDSAALTTVRRSFHTLKGSGRMVGLKDLGEAAWAIEQTLNLWLRLELAAVTRLTGLLDEAYGVFSEWVRQLETQTGHAPDPQAMIARASALRTDTAQGVILQTLETPDAMSEPAQEAETAESAPLADKNAGTGSNFFPVDSRPVSPEETDDALAWAVSTNYDGSQIQVDFAPVSPLETTDALALAVSTGDDGSPIQIDFAPVSPLETTDALAWAVSTGYDGSQIQVDFAPVSPEETTDALALATSMYVDESPLPTDFTPLIPLETTALPVLTTPMYVDESPLPTDLAPASQRETAAIPTAVTAPAADSQPPVLDNPEAHAAVAEAVPMFPDTGTTAPASAPSESASESASETPPRLGISPALFAIFSDEARSYLRNLRRDLPVLESEEVHPTPHEMYRAAHTLAGISATVGLLPLNRLAHTLECALQRRDGAKQPGSVHALATIRRTIGELELMLQAVLEQQHIDDPAELIEELDSLYPAGNAPEETARGEPITETAAEETGPTTAPETLESSPAETWAAASEPKMSATPPASPPIASVNDEIDEQLLPIFLEEAVDLTQGIAEQLRAWRGSLDDAAAVRVLARHLHTLKGSARMTGAMTLGEITHALEERVDQASHSGEVSTEVIDGIESAFESIRQIVERLQRGETIETDSAAPENTALPVTAEAEADAAPTAPQRAEDKRRIRRPEADSENEAAQTSAQATLRVRAGVVDRLVNEAGELSIARSRIEGEMRGLKESLLDLTENVIRLRRQLREIEIQAESQIQSRAVAADERYAGFDPLEFDRFTRFQELTRMIAESVNDVSAVQQHMLKNLDDANAAIAAQARLNREVQQELMAMRMMPFSSLADRLYRVVRQVSKDLDKRANMEIKGGQVELDRGVLDRIAAPLEHMLRNAVAHGIENRAERIARGKSEIGEIALSLYQEGNEIVVLLSDDGAGLDYRRIRERAAATGLLGADEAIDEARLAEFIFAPGFSTAAALSQVAGRGVGMDVVKTEIASLGGRVEIESTPGQGTEFRLILPLTLVVTKALLIRAGSRMFAIPSSMIEQVLDLKEDELNRIRQAGSAEWQSNRYVYNYLPHLLGDLSAAHERRRRYWILLLHSGTRRIAVQVDELLGNQEIVVKNIGEQLARIIGVDGATVLGSGQVVLILNPVALSTRTLTETSARVAETPPDDVSTDEPEQTAPPPTVMVVDDSLTVRKITGRLIAREGYRVILAKDGIDALEKLFDIVPDVMLVDLEMPRMDGFDLTRNIRADARLKDVPIIMITSRTAEKHRRQAFAIGVSHYLGKPYQEDELLRLMSDCMAARKQV
ncbi:MAG: Hpt domain-containing protein [Candidatus Accumulibacter sp.]|jgi:chemosensory pili system protein ChpA (sensor histidine kinase/response regulator)|nr:Hpt domain-containing protein [Accumulibacter sp.]